MAWIRQRPSGKWAATAYTPAGRKTESFRLKGSAEAWAAELERDIRHGEFVDPKAGKINVQKLWDMFKGARHQEKASKARDLSHWRTHVQPAWGRWAVSTILKPDISAWVVKMGEDGVGAATIQGSLGVLRGLLEHAVDAKMIRSNPALKVKTPKRTKHVDRVFSHDEEEQLLKRLEELFPGRPDAELFVRVLFGTGMRWEEVAAFPPEMVDRRRRLITVRDVMERDGTIRDYPKGDASNRQVPIEDDLWPDLLAQVDATPAGRAVFVAENGGPLRYTNWRDRVWNRALTVDVADDAARDAYAARFANGEKRPPGPPPRFVKRVHYMRGPQGTAHDCRHSYATRVGKAGMPAHELAALLGHASITTVQRYLHADDDRFDRAREALQRAKRKG